MSQRHEQNRQCRRVLVVPSMPVGEIVNVLAVPGAPRGAGENAQISHRGPAQSRPLLKVHAETQNDDKTDEKSDAFTSREFPIALATCHRVACCRQSEHGQGLWGKTLLAGALTRSDGSKETPRRAAVSSKWVGMESPF